MADCEFHRLCSTNDTTTAGSGKYAGTLIYVESEERIFAAWMERGAIKFAKYDPITHTPDSEVTIYSYTPDTTVSSVEMVRRADGVLVVCWFDRTNFTFISESSDNGATWTTVPTSLGGVNDMPVGMYDNGTNVVICVVGIAGGGVGVGDLKAFKRTGVDTWSAVSSKFYDSTVSDPTNPSAATNQNKNCHHGLYMSTALIGVLVMWRSEASANNTRRLTAFTTTDGFATSTRVDIRLHTADGGDNPIHSVVTSDGRFWVMWPDPDSAANKPRFAYTDDVGTTWTDVGIPPLVTTTMAAQGISSLDPDDQGICLDLHENINLFHSTENALGGSGIHTVYRSVDPADSDWVLQGTCDYDTTDDTWSSIPTGRSVVDPTTGIHHRLTTLIRHDGSDHYTLEFLSSQGIPPEPERPPPTEESEESAADDNNIMFRIDLFDGRGFSVHAHAASCAVTWDEGDRETGLGVKIMATGSPSMDPAIASVALLPGLWRVCVDNEDGYGKRQYVDLDGAGAMTTRYDPLRSVWRSAKMHLEDFFKLGVLRGFFLDYRKDGLGTLPVQIWLDDRHHRTIEFPPTGGQFVQSRLRALSTFTNPGTTLQFVIDETSVDPWWVNGVRIMYIPKGYRG